MTEDKPGIDPCCEGDTDGDRGDEEGLLFCAVDSTVSQIRSSIPPVIPEDPGAPDETGGVTYTRMRVAIENSFPGFVPSPALKDECASYFKQAWLDAGHGNAPQALDLRSRVWENKRACRAKRMAALVSQLARDLERLDEDLAER